MHNDPTANNTQLVRHELQFASEADNEQLIAARELLIEHGFVVDTLTATEAIVTSVHGTDPDWQRIKEVFQQLNWPIIHVTTAE